uniref:GM05133p n=1 Tax=Drosophila melanogaster TaxID=7227 RepID=Q8T3N5_DROME|nr:GM05133p [Drosophila melanogaster]
MYAYILTKTSEQQIFHKRNFHRQKERLKNAKCKS